MVKPLAALTVALLAATLAQAELHRGHSIGFGAGREEWRGEVELLSWQPRLYHLRGFLSEAECEHLKALGEPHLRNSSVVDRKTGRPTASTVRTSKGTFLRHGQDAVVKRIESRVAQVSMLPVTHQESMQILRYQLGEKYLPHHDFFQHDSLCQPEHGGQRILTLLMYLATPMEGGETVFPRASTKASGPGWSECARDGLAVKAVKGDAVMFYGLHPNGTKDISSMHGSCPVITGEKWSATKWIRQGPRSAVHA